MNTCENDGARNGSHLDLIGVKLGRHGRRLSGARERDREDGVVDEIARISTTIELHTVFALEMPRRKRKISEVEMDSSHVRA